MAISLKNNLFSCLLYLHGGSAHGLLDVSVYVVEVKPVSKTQLLEIELKKEPN